MSSDGTMSPIAWLVIAIFAAIVLIIALIYLFALKVRRDKRIAARKAENDEIFANIIRNPITK
jgi:uncharacterized membrane protein